MSLECVGEWWVNEWIRSHGDFQSRLSSSLGDLLYHNTNSIMLATLSATLYGFLYVRVVKKGTRVCLYLFSVANNMVLHSRCICDLSLPGTK